MSVPPVVRLHFLGASHVHDQSQTVAMPAWQQHPNIWAVNRYSTHGVVEEFTNPLWHVENEETDDSQIWGIGFLTHFRIDPYGPYQLSYLWKRPYFFEKKHSVLHAFHSQMFGDGKSIPFCLDDSPL